MPHKFSAFFLVTISLFCPQVTGMEPVVCCAAQLCVCYGLCRAATITQEELNDGCACYGRASMCSDCSNDTRSCLRSICLHKWCRPKEKTLEAPAVPEMERDADLAHEVPYVPLALRYRFPLLLPVLNQKNSVFDASSSQKNLKNEPKEK